MSSIKIRSMSGRKLFLCLFMLSVLLVSTGVSFAAGSGTKAYAVEAVNNILLSFPTNSTGTLTSLANLAGTKITGADFLLSDTTSTNLYLIDGYEHPVTNVKNNALYNYNTSTGTITLISDTEISGTTMAETGENWSGLTGDATTLYASSTNCAGSSTLYTIDPATGAATVVGTIAANCIQGIAIDSAGNQYG